MGHLVSISETEIYITSPLPFSKERKDASLQEEVASFMEAVHKQLIPKVRNKEWDTLRVEYWFDAGDIIIFPRNSPAEPYDRLDEYIKIKLENYAKEFERLIDSGAEDDVCDKWASQSMAKIASAFESEIKSKGKDICRAAGKKSCAFEIYNCGFDLVKKMKV